MAMKRFGKALRDEGAMKSFLNCDEFSDDSLATAPDSPPGAADATPQAPAPKPVACKGKMRQPDFDLDIPEHDDAEGEAADTL
eukprot:4972173-Karenia_brevis.AAC.1